MARLLHIAVLILFLISVSEGQVVVCTSTFGSEGACGTTGTNLIENELYAEYDKTMLQMSYQTTGMHNVRKLQGSCSACTRTNRPPFCVVLGCGRRRLFEFDSEAETEILKNRRKLVAKDVCGSLKASMAAELNALGSNTTLSAMCRGQLASWLSHPSF
jgi:hypothetical protein